MKINLNSFLTSVSIALDAVEEELFKTTTNHSKRVSYIALRLAELYDLDEKTRFDLCSYAIVHDNGVIQAYQKSKKEKKSLELEGLESHCEIGEKNIKNFPFLTKQKDIILYHHERYDGKGFYGKKEDEIPLLSQLIYIADMLDTNFELNNITLSTQEAVIQYVINSESTLFSPKMVEKFLELSQVTSFWFDLDRTNILNIYSKRIPEFNIDITYKEMLEISNIFSRIIDAKSEFTARHTNELVEKAKIIADYYELNEDKSYKLQIAANLHDLGKLSIPIDILEKPGPLTKDELFIMKKHAYFTFSILDTIKGFEEINKIASSHHERLDGNGYPFGLEDIQLDFEERLLACLDVYQALIEERPYRKAMSHNDAMEILNSTVESKILDKEIIKSIDLVFKEIA